MTSAASPPGPRGALGPGAGRAVREGSGWGVEGGSGWEPLCDGRSPPACLLLVSLETGLTLSSPWLCPGASLWKSRAVLPTWPLLLRLPVPSAPLRSPARARPAASVPRAGVWLTWEDRLCCGDTLSSRLAGDTPRCVPPPGLEDTPAVLSSPPAPGPEEGPPGLGPGSWTCSSVLLPPWSRRAAVLGPARRHSAERLWLRVACELVSGQRPQPPALRALYDCLRTRPPCSREPLSP